MKNTWTKNVYQISMSKRFADIAHAAFCQVRSNHSQLLKTLMISAPFGDRDRVAQYERQSPPRPIALWPLWLS